MAREWTLDKAHSTISFTIRHMTVSKVRGQFKDFSVTIQENEKDRLQSKVTATIKAASIDTNNEKRDGHLRSKDFFEVDKYPEITFTSYKITKAAGKYKVTGTLKMHGVAREVTLKASATRWVEDHQGNLRIGIEAYATIDRKDFNITWNRALDRGGMLLGNSVNIEILLELIHKRKAS